MTQIEFPNIQFKITTGNTVIFDSNSADPLVTLESVSLDEDMFSESIIGSISLFDPTGGAAVINSIQFQDLITITVGSTSWNFDILDINWVSDLATQSLSSYGTPGLVGRPHKAIVRFSSKLFTYNNFNYSPIYDFIGRISGTGKEPNISDSALSPDPATLLNSFVHELVRFAGITDSEFSADNTANSIWFKHDPALYPFFKLGNNSTIHQIMNYVSEYACREDSPGHVDFLFWQDLTGWKFKSVSKMAEQSAVASYTISTNELDTDAIASFEVINTISPTQLISSGAFFGEYVRIKPKWDSVNQNALDTDAELHKERIVGEYLNNIPGLGIASNTIQNFLPEPQNTGTLRMVDTNYGFFVTPYNANSPWWSYAKNINEYANDLTDLKQPERNEKNYWRAQFDFSELPASWLHKIYTKIKWNPNLLQKKQEYLELKREKIKHDVFKNKVCCIKEVPETFFAVITKAEKIHGSDGQLLSIPGVPLPFTIQKDSGGVYAYDWVEVEFWPREDAESVLRDRQIIEFENDSFPFVFAVPPGAAQGRGVVENSPDTRAYNLNEILNSQIPRTFEGGTLGYTIMKGPGISNIHALVPDDSETRKEYVSYPKNFSLMPVGKFRVTTKKTCDPVWADDGTVSNGSPDFYQGGRVVQMFKIPKQSLTAIIGKTLASETRPTPPLTDIFIFDVENDHDGLCATCGT